MTKRASLPLPEDHALIFYIGRRLSEPLGALVIAEHRENRLIDRRRVGSGISTKTLEELLSLLRSLGKKNGVTWVDPSLQIRVNLLAPRGPDQRFTLSRASFPRLPGGDSARSKGSAILRRPKGAISVFRSSTAFSHKRDEDFLDGKKIH